MTRTLLYEILYATATDCAWDRVT